MKNKDIYKELHILSISFKSEHIINNFLKQFDKKFKITLVENSNNSLLKKKLEKKFKNLNVIISGNNLGFGKAFNLGIKNIYAKYVLHLNPDAKINYQNIKRLFYFLKKNRSAAIVAPREILNKKNNKKIILSNKLFSEVDYVKGSVYVLNVKNCKKTNFFDENFFLYMEEVDLCKRLKLLNKKIYLLNTAEAMHLGGKSHNPQYNFQMELQRNWHFMWSLYYLIKSIMASSLQLK